MLVRTLVAREGAFLQRSFDGVGIKNTLVRFNQTAAAPLINPSALRSRRAKVDALTVTDAAVNRIKTLLERKPEATGVRLGVRTRGCNGLSYTLDYLVGEPKPGEDLVETRGVRVVIEPKALIHIVGTTMDYKEDALAAEFVFNNPNAKGSCGCGESFNV